MFLTPGFGLEGHKYPQSQISLSWLALLECSFLNRLSLSLSSDCLCLGRVLCCACLSESPICSLSFDVAPILETHSQVCDCSLELTSSIVIAVTPWHMCVTFRFSNKVASLLL